MMNSSICRRPIRRCRQLWTGILAESSGLDRARTALAKGAVGREIGHAALRWPRLRDRRRFCASASTTAIMPRRRNATIPTEPIVFSKFATAIISPGVPIVLPRVSTKVDYEAELVVVLGKGGKNIPAARAMAHVAGYMNGNDVSARDWQTEKPGKQWLLGKTPDTFAPIGPYLVTADEVPDFRKLPISCGSTARSCRIRRRPS